MLMAKARVTDLHQRVRGRVLLLVVSLLLIYVVVPRLGNFADSLEAIKGAEFGFVAAALLPLVGTYLIAAGMYQCLALRRLRYKRTFLIQAASGFANRLLPAGLGGLTLNVQYLKKSGHTLPQALAVAGTNNTLGFVGHMLLLGVAVAFGGDRLTQDLQLPHVSYGGWIGAGLLLVIIANLVVFQKLRKYLYSLTADTAGNIVATFRNRPSKVAAALSLSLGLTAAYVLVFYMCGLAVGISLPVSGMFAVFTIGLIATTATPTPGGLGGAEAGLVAGLVAYGVDTSTALACVLLYRLLTFWLPILPGFLIFLRIRKTYL
jgi:glycosyltransferase 2 family protein